MIKFLHVRRAIADGEFENIPVFAESGALSLSDMKSESVNEQTRLRTFEPTLPATKAPPTTESFVEESLLCALLAMSARDVVWETVLNQWSAAAPRMQCPALLTALVESIRRVCSATPTEVYRQYAATGSPRFTQVAAALRLVTHPDTTPSMCHVGLCMLVTDTGFATNFMLSHEALAELTRKAWRARLSTPFELCSPRLTVPAIRTACESHKKGLALAATILLAAGDAVSVGRKASIQSKLQKLAYGEKGG